MSRIAISTPVALLIGFALVPVAYAVAWVGGRLLDWWTRPRGHCHDTGMIRGAVCAACNARIGIVERTPALEMPVRWWLTEVRTYLATPLS